MKLLHYVRHIHVYILSRNAAIPALHMVKYNSRFTSENYQVMNYGVGGYISLHMDEHALPNFLSLCMGGGNTTDSDVTSWYHVAG